MRCVSPCLLVGCTYLLGCAGDFKNELDAAPDLGKSDGSQVYACETVDILFVIDNSDSMEAEQKSLIANFPRFIEKLNSFDPGLRSYHIGVITTDIGAGPYTIGTCSPPGDDGMLQHEAQQGSGCAAASYPKFLEGPSATLAADFACIANVGLKGCGYEQQMEAALKALTRQSYNEGFLRDNAPLAIVFVSDEDDCSARDTALFDYEDLTLGDYRSRCVRLTEKLHPVSRYVDGFRKLKDDPERVVVAAITGPKGEVQFSSDPKNKDTVLPICTSDTLGDANPGNRFVELIEGLGNQGIHHSICNGDFSQPLDVIASALEHACID